MPVQKFFRQQITFKMTRLFTTLFFVVLFALQSQAQLKGVLNKAKQTVLGTSELSQEETGNALKEALNIGVNEAVDFLSKKDGYFLSPYKILVPEEARKVISKLKVVPGFSDVEQQLIEKMNRAAEDAAIKAKPIFVNAIKQMSFKDALNILMGNKDAATRYLESTTGKQLYAEFMPVIQASLDKVNARDYWRTAVNAYNKIPFIEKTNPELDDHVNQTALKGLFSLVETKERGIRSDVNLRSSELLKRVFAKQDKSGK
jgi:hypothetical protein